MRNLLAFFALLAIRAYGQGCTGYAHTYDVTIPTASVTATLASFTVMVQGTYAGGGSGMDLRGTGSGGFATNGNGFDIAFAKSGSLLTWSMPRYVSATGEIRANVLMPASLTTTAATVFQICVGKGSVTTFQGGTNPYDTNTQMALQFTSGSISADDTGLQTAVSCGAHCPTYSSSGPTHIGDALTFNGTTQYIDYGATPGFAAGGTSRTETFWINPTSLSTTPIWFEYGTAGAGRKAFGSIAFSPNWQVWDDTGIGSATASSLTLSGWQRLDCVYDSAGGPIVRYYRNGVADGTASVGTAIATVLLGSSVGSKIAHTGNFFNGSMAGLKFANIARPAAWIAAEYLNQNNPDPGFYTIAAQPIPPVITVGPTCSANSPSSVTCSWTTDIKSDSEIRCATVSGGPYSYTSDVINPVDTVAVADFWGVTSHSMPSGGAPNGNVWCIVLSKGKTGGTIQSAEVATSTAAAAPVSRPMTVASIGAITRIDDSNTGQFGAPLVPGQLMQGDSGAFTWAEDDNVYFLNGTFGVGNSLHRNSTTSPFANRNAWMSFQTTNMFHTLFTNVNTAWQNGVGNMDFNSYGVWFGFNTISVKGSMYNWLMDYPAGSRPSLMKTTDHYQSTLAPLHNVGPTTTNLTNLTCSSGTVTATSQLNLTDLFPTICDGGIHSTNCSLLPTGIKQDGDGMAVIVAGVTGGTNANGVFGPVTAVTPTTISWAQTCSGWNGGSGATGTGGTINVYGWDIPQGTMPGGSAFGNWIQSDGKDYNGTKIAGMDAYVYFWNTNVSTTGVGLCRIRIENLPVQRGGLWGCYNGKQNGDDGLYSANWDYSSTRESGATVMNQNNTSFRAYGRGGLAMQEQYVPTFNRFLGAYEMTAVTDSWGGGSVIYDAGQYPWSPIRQIGNRRRNVNLYPSATPQFPQFDARTMTQLDANTVSIGLSNDGGNFGKTTLNYNSMTAYMTRDVILVPRAATVPSLIPSGLAGQEVTAGLDLAYDFDVQTGSQTMPNLAPADAKQQWAWRGFNNQSRLWIDRYGSFNPTSASVSMANGNGSIPTSEFHANVVDFAPTEVNLTTPLLNTPYTQTLGASTTLYCFGHYPTTLLSNPAANAIALNKSGDLKIAWVSGNNWAVTFKATALGNVSIADNSIGCLVIRRDSSNRVTVYNSDAIGSSLPLTPVLGPTVVTGAWSSSNLVMGDAANSFFGIVSLLRVWNRDLGDDELIGEMAAVRTKLRPRGGPASNIP